MTTATSRVPPRPEAPAERAAIAEDVDPQPTHAVPRPSGVVPTDKDDPRFWPVVRAILFAEPKPSPAGDAPLGSPEARERRPDVPISFHASAVGGEAAVARRPVASPTMEPKRHRGRASRRRHNDKHRARRLGVLRRRVEAMRREIRRLKKRR